MHFGFARSHVVWRVTFVLGLAGGLAGPLPTPVSARAVVPDVTAELQMLSYGDLDAAELGGTRHSARALLSTAGIRVEWRDCSDAVGGCDTVELGRVAIRVRLRPERKKTEVTACGEVVRDYLNRPVVVVYLPPHADLVPAFRFHVAARSNPALGEVRMGQLVGLTLAHEIGHLLGLPHALSGVMKARPALEEVTALVAQSLAFEVSQGSRMRLTLLERSTTVVADRR